MSNRKLIDPSIVTGIADAIRNKKGTTATIQVSHLADEIASIQTMAQSTKDLVNAVSGVTPTDEISLNNGIASGVVDAPSVHSWADTRSTADGGTIKDGIAYVKALRGKSIKVNQLVADPTFADASKWKNYYNNADLVIENNVLKATFTGTGTVFPQSKIATPKVYASHKYFMFVDFKKSVSESTRISFSYLVGGFNGCAVTKTFGTSWERVAFVGNAWSDTNNGYMSIALSGMTQGTELYLRNFCVIDLTACGIDTLTTADAVAQYFGYASVNDMLPLPYQADTIVLNSKQKSVISKSNIKTVDLGSLTWLKGTYAFCLPFNTFVDCADFSSMAIPSYTYAGLSAAGQTMGDKTYSPQPDKNSLYIKDSSYTTATAFKAAMSGVMLTYESTEYTTLDTLTLPTLTAFPHGLCSNGTTYDEVILSEGKAYKRIADDGTILDTPQEVTFTPQRAYYKASNNGQEVATADTATAPFTAEIGYKEPTATELANALNA